MNKHTGLFFALILNTLIISAQTPISRNIQLTTEIPKETQAKLLDPLDTLLLHISKGNPGKEETDAVDSAFSLSIFNYLRGIESNEKEKNQHFYKPQLINLYRIGYNKYFISVAFINNSATGSSIRSIVNFVAAADSNRIRFAVPLTYLTRNWKTATVGDVTYHYSDNINLERAKKFDQTNTRIATKFGLPVEKLNFYLCDNYQDVLKLIGLEYDSQSAGVVENGLGVDEGIIFSVMHNEDFSHDLFHYYSAKVRKNPRNSAADEGVAYTWGNAYYVDQNGEVINQRQMVVRFKQYLLSHPQESLLDLFTKNPLIFGDETKVRSMLSGLICDEVERREGVPGIKALLDCGKGDDNYFKVVDEFTGINKANFDVRVMELLNAYK